MAIAKRTSPPPPPPPSPSEGGGRGGPLQPSPSEGGGRVSAFEYAPAPEATDHVRIAPRYDLFIGGRFVRAHSRRRFATVNPATEEVLSEVAEADEADVDRAVTAAAGAFRGWSALPPARRGPDGVRPDPPVTAPGRGVAGR